MSEYFLADVRKQERERQRNRDREPQPTPKPSQEMKVTLLGDFLFPSSEPQGCDPYNATHGKSAREAWKRRQDRR